MSNIDKQALRDEFKMMQECYSDPADHDRQVIYIAAEALLDELEAKDKSISFLKDQFAQLANFNPDWDKLEAATYSLREHMAELTAARKRIAELEARTVTLPENITSANAPEVFEISAEAERLGLRGTYASYAVGCNARGMADKEALRADSICIDGES
ncbi:hypothetical protein DP196_23975 [Enterobacter hormaechei subsp. steigerwaltii]|uniref:ead/Ea22-like family protein n=1 Tax=Enterobacter hormaechei TaxID=158836 RepID=UPI000DCE7BCB|nr:ead/Ea22-like family protein [Enterobacter hormaechei]RAY86359.1 hypothetical protein DP196_23975 [Enterobacter hormaechei subsp. steigerwaltii]